MLKLLQQLFNKVTGDPFLPVDVMELVVDELGSRREDPECFQSLLGCALASRSLTHRSQRYIFQKISLAKPQDIGLPNRLIEQLYELMQKRPELKDHIRSLKLALHGKSGVVLQILESQYLRGVMKMLSDANLEEVGVVISGHFRGINWATNSPGSFFTELDALIRSPRMTSLSLDNIFGVPTTLIYGTHMKQISFRQLGLVRSPIVVGASPCPHLESIEVDCSFPFPRLLTESEDDIHYTRDNTAPYPPLPSVKHVALFLDHSSDIRAKVPLLASCPALRTLHLEMLTEKSRMASIGGWAQIPFANLPRLRRLVFRYYAPIRYHHEPVALTELREMLIAQKEVSLSLEEIAIELKIVHEYSLRWVYPHDPCWVAVNQELEKWGHIKRVNISLDYRYKYTRTERDGEFEEGAFLKRCQDQLSDVFPSLTKADKITLKVVPRLMDPDSLSY